MKISTFPTYVAVRLRLAVADRRDRIREDAGVTVLEYVVLAAIIIPAVILLGAFLIQVIQNRQNAIR